MTAKRSILMLLTCCLLLATRAENPARDTAICDMQAAREWCDGAMLHNVEGIWEFPDDETHVLIRRTAGYDNRYDIIVVDSPDTRMIPGETIGTLTPSVETTKFEMRLFRNRTKQGLGNPGKCLATLNAKQDAMTVSGAKFSFNPTFRWMLPSFWNIVKMNIRPGVSKPTDKIPFGLVRTYPVYSRRQPDYL